MQKSKRLKVLTAVIIGCLSFALAYFFISRKPASRAQLNSIGTVSAMIGEAEQRLPQALEFESLEAGDTLYSGQMITVQNASEVTLTFDGGGSVKLLPGARFVSVPDATAPEGSVLGLLMEGEAVVTSRGTPPTLRVLKNGKDLLPNEPSPVAAPVVASGNSAADAKPAMKPVIITPTTALETPTPSPRDTRGENIGGPNKPTGETLGNDEIRKAIRGNSGFIQRCYLTYLNRAKPEPSSKMSAITVGFIISSSGKVRDAKIVRSDFKDSVLNNCILETVERTSFRPFRGNDVPVLEFPIELQ